ncbi:MAG: NifB/NifX family molybdenum-iron cluster-binding protein [Acidobacteriota bacterium]|nr:NifB/NifX family molybdenum-iron cluster-binding protein [Acidobacteriota bacterium]
MRIAIATDKGFVSAHFGRCPSYTIVDIEEGKVIKSEEIANPGHSPGFLPRFLADKGVDVIIAGGMGPRAKGHFAENNIQVITGVQGKVEEVIERFVRQEIRPGQDLCEHGGEHQHHHEPFDHDFPQEKPGQLIGKICITSKGPDLEAEVEDVFGRAAYFIFVEPETMEFEAYKNPAVEEAHGVGIQSAQLMAEKGVKAVLIGGQVGPNARRVLEAAGIHVIIVNGGTVKEVIEGLKRN